jgi:ABC-type transporter Mla maintaining outer membrane lipid asymmetry ATPase subunit MlaF
MGGTSMQDAQYIVLRCAGSVPLILERGYSHNIVLHTDEEHKALLLAISEDDGIWIVPENGGMITNLRVWENITLPVRFHGVEIIGDVSVKIVQLLKLCGWHDEISISSLMRKQPEQLSLYEKRVIAFVRTMLLEPESICFDFLYRGLIKSESESASKFVQVYRQLFPFGTTISLGFKANADSADSRQRTHSFVME